MHEIVCNVFKSIESFKRIKKNLINMLGLDLICMLITRFTNQFIFQFDGSVMLVILTLPEKFIRRLSDFLYILSQSMRTRFRVETEDDHKRIYFWDFFNGTGPLTDNSDMAMTVESAFTQNCFQKGILLNINMNIYK